MVDPVTRQVLEVIAAATKIPVADLTPNHSLADLGLDSLDTLTLLFSLEETFRISIPDDSAQSIRTVQDVINGVRRLQASSRAAE